MLNFVYDNKTTLIFGKGTHHETGTLLKPLGKKILLKDNFSIRCLEIFTFQQDIYYRIFTLTAQSYEAMAD